MADLVTGQADFSAGMYRGREAPENAAYDLSNFLLDDEGQPFRRGGTAYYSSGTYGGSQTMGGILNAFLVPGVRTLQWAPTAGTAGIYALSEDLASFTQIQTSPPKTFSRPTRAGRFVCFLHGAVGGTAQVTLYGGSRRVVLTDYTTGSVTVTNGSRTVTGAGTGWVAAGLEPGEVFSITVGGKIYDMVVASVDGATQVTLHDPWPAATAAGASYAARVMTVATMTLAGAVKTSAIGTAGGRLLVGVNNRMYFSEPDAPGTVDDVATTYHEFPTGTMILAIEGIGNAAYVFTTGGVWRVGNLEFDAIDDVGNVQHTVELISKDTVAWGEGGIVGWGGALIVPVPGDVLVVAPDGATRSIAEGMRPLLASYFAGGALPGIASVYRNHYFLPILTSAGVPYQTLVCRLDRGFAWTGAGDDVALCPAFSVREDTTPPKLLGAAHRIRDLSGIFTPAAGNAAEADGTVHFTYLATRDYATPGGSKGSTATRLHLRYEAEAVTTPVIDAWSSQGPPGSSASLMTLIRGNGVSDGLSNTSWKIRKRVPAVRFELESAAAFSSFKVREIEVLWRQAG